MAHQKIEIATSDLNILNPINSLYLILLGTNSDFEHESGLMGYQGKREEPGRWSKTPKVTAPLSPPKTPLHQSRTELAGIQSARAPGGGRSQESLAGAPKVLLHRQFQSR